MPQISGLKDTTSREGFVLSYHSTSTTKDVFVLYSSTKQAASQQNNPRLVRKHLPGYFYRHKISFSGTYWILFTGIRYTQFCRCQLCQIKLNLSWVDGDGESRESRLYSYQYLPEPEAVDLHRG